MKSKSWKSAALVWAVLSIFVAYLLAVLAEIFMQPDVDLFILTDGLTKAFSKPLALTWTEKTPAFLIVGLIVYAFAAFCYETTKGNKRPGEEHGSAGFAEPGSIDRKYRDKKNRDQNVILTQNVQISLDGYKHRRNQNVFIIGGPGTGKTRGYVLPNLMQCGASYVVCDPKGEISRSVGGLLEEQGYDVRIIDLIEMTGHYNPFNYMHTDEDVLRVIQNLIDNTTPKNANVNDPFWEKAETALLQALMLLLFHEAPKHEQNFPMVMYLLNNAAVREEDESYKSPIDILFERLEEEQPDHIAVSQYKVFKQAAGKTAKSILISAAVRLTKFNLPGIKKMTSDDDLDIASLGDRKRAIFCIVPDNDNSFNYLVAMMYTQAFQTLYSRADRYYMGPLKVPVLFIMDEFANVALPDNFENILSTCRSRGIGISIIVQDIAQLKKRYKDSWEHIIACCSCFLYLGGNEFSTQEYVSKMIGKETVDTTTRGLTKGNQGHSSENYQNAGRDLAAPDEVRRLDDQHTLLFISGERPVLDKMYDLKTHRNFKKTAQGGAKPYLTAPEFGHKDLSWSRDNPDDIEILK